MYWATHPGVELADNPTVRLDQDNEPQPDAVLRYREGGASQVSADDYIEGAPELVVEISASTVSIDMNAKKQAYQRNGVAEYLVWLVEEQTVHWFYLEAGVYQLLPINDQGVIESQVFPGLLLCIPALLEGDLSRVLAYK